MNHKESHQITLRGLSPELVKKLLREAHEKKISLNRVILERFEQKSAKSADGACKSLLCFAGTWDEKQARDFGQALAQSRKIETELWK